MRMWRKAEENCRSTAGPCPAVNWGRCQTPLCSRSMKVLKLGKAVGRREGGRLGAGPGPWCGLLSSGSGGRPARWSRGPGLGAGVPWAWMQGISGEEETQSWGEGEVSREA